MIFRRSLGRFCYFKIEIRFRSWWNKNILASLDVCIEFLLLLLLTNKRRKTTEPFCKKHTATQLSQCSSNGLKRWPGCNTNKRTTSGMEGFWMPKNLFGVQKVFFPWNVFACVVSAINKEKHFLGDIFFLSWVGVKRLARHATANQKLSALRKLFFLLLFLGPNKMSINHNSIWVHVCYYLGSVQWWCINSLFLLFFGFVGCFGV